MPSKSEIYQESLAAFCRGDFEAATACYADDIVAYPNRAMRPMLGRATMQAFMQKFGAGMEDARYAPSLMVESGDFLFVEGTETYRKNGRSVSIPYAGVMEFRGDKIIGWRDYFDLKSLEKQLAA